MKRTTMAQRIVDGLLERGYEQVRKSKSEVMLRSRQAKLTFIVQNCGKVLSVRNKVATEICH